MPWKEPGDKSREPRDRGPWGRGQGNRGGGPDLDAWLKKLRRGIGPFGRGPLGVVAAIVVLILAWFAIGGWTSIGAQQVGVVLRMGRIDGVLQPGLHLHLPAPIDEVQKVDVGRTRAVGDETRLLTRDGQLVLVDYDVRYKVTNARDYLFATRDAEDVLRTAATAAMRTVVGSHDLRCLITDLDLPCTAGTLNAAKLAAAALERLRATLGDTPARIGIALDSVNVQQVGVPQEVKPAFDDIAKAREDAQTAAVAASAAVVQGKVKAAAQAAAIKTDAAAYRQEVVASAKASVARFDQILAQFKAAPQVTRQRLWLAAMQDVLTKNHVVLNTGSGGVIVQFPPRPVRTPADASGAAPASSSSAPAPASSVTPPVTSGPGVKAVDP